MLSIKNFKNIYFFRPFADFRKGIDGLSLIVQEEMFLNPFENYLFIFCNNKRDKIKALYWDKTGFALWYKRLEKEKYKWPSHLDGESVKIDLKVLEQFLVGLNPWEKPHEKLIYSVI